MIADRPKHTCEKDLLGVSVNHAGITWWPFSTGLQGKPIKETRRKMYLAQPDGIPAVIHGPFHDLAEAIRRGVHIYPVQLNGLGGMEAIPQIGAACVMGAAAAGGWPVNRYAADESWGPRGQCHVCGKDEPISLAAHHNNFHGTPREQIADWLDAIR